MTNSVQPGLTGVWRREVITTPGGHRDAETHVFWLQTRSWYGDIRIPPKRPVHAGAADFQTCSAEDLIELAGMQGFAGQLTADDAICVWRRDLDFQPPSKSPDEGTYELDSETMIERGIHADYEEVWRLEPASRGALLAFSLAADSRLATRRGLLLVAGDHFMSIIDRPTPLPAAETLRAAVSAALTQSGPAAAAELLAMPIVYGRISSGETAWAVTHSTWPWLEGKGFWSGSTVRFDPDAGVLSQVSPDLTRSWGLLDSSTPIDEIADHMRLPTGASEPTSSKVRFD